jgi:hypothetical protein
MNRVEGAAAAPHAAVYSGNIDWRKIAQGRDELNVYVIFTGGNIPKEKWVGIAGEHSK